MPSVSVALRGLADRGLVNYDPYQVVTLTEQGQRLGRAIDHRHQVLGEFFTRVLGLDDAVAQANACRIEHAIDPAVLDRLQRLLGIHPGLPQDRAAVAERRSDPRRRRHAAQGRLPPMRRPKKRGGKMSQPVICAPGLDVESPHPRADPAGAGPPGPGGRAGRRAGAPGVQHRLAEMGLRAGVRLTVAGGGRGGPLILAIGDTRLVLGQGLGHRVMVYPQTR